MIVEVLHLNGSGQWEPSDKALIYLLRACLRREITARVAAERERRLADSMLETLIAAARSAGRQQEGETHGARTALDQVSRELSERILENETLTKKLDAARRALGVICLDLATGDL